MRAKKVNESTLNPYDKIGVMMAQEYGVDLGFETTKDGLGVKQKGVDKIKTNKKKKDPFGTSKLGQNFKPTKVNELALSSFITGKDTKINESSTSQTMMNIRNELTSFLTGVVIPQSKGHVSSERNAALHLYDILKERYKIGN